MNGIEIIAKERERQITEENWDAEHDDSHIYDELATAAACYAVGIQLHVHAHDSVDQDLGYDNIWPWDQNSWKPTPENRIKELAKAGALIAAEIDRIQRRNSSNGCGCSDCGCSNTN